MRHVVAAPRGGQSNRRCFDLLAATYDQQPDVADAPEDVEVVRLVASWFRRIASGLFRPDQVALSALTVSHLGADQFSTIDGREIGPREQRLGVLQQHADAVACEPAA